MEQRTGYKGKAAERDKMRGLPGEGGATAGTASREAE
jgi:hypothetical protein